MFTINLGGDTRYLHSTLGGAYNISGSSGTITLFVNFMMVKQGYVFLFTIEAKLVICL